MPIRVVQVVDSRASCLQVASILRAMHHTADFAPRWIHLGHEDDASLSPDRSEPTSSSARRPKPTIASPT